MRSPSSTPTGEVLHRFAVTHDAAGLKSLVRRLLTAGVDEVGIERGDGPVVEALIQAGLTVLVIPPGQLKNLRSRYGSAGNKDDRYDAYILADVVRTDRRRLRPLVRDSAATTALRTTVRARRDLVDHRVAAANQLRAHLQIVFPGAASLFADDRLRDQPHVPRAVHHPSPGRLALAQTPGRLVVLGVLQRSHRSRDPARPAARSTTGNHRRRRRHPHRDNAGVRRDPALAEHPDRGPRPSIGEQLAIHPDAHIFTSLPRSGTVRAARLLAEIGDARGRFPTADSLACLAGVAPSTRQSGKVKAVTFRWGANKELRDALCDFAGDSRHANPWAADLYAKARARGHDHPHAVRILARAWVHIIWRAWQDNVALRPRQARSPPSAAHQHHRKGGLNDAGLTQGNSWGLGCVA